MKDIEKRMCEEEDRFSQVQAKVQEATDVEESIRLKVSELQQQVIQARDEKASLM